MWRSETDRVDADVLAEFAARMAFVPWKPPEEAVFEVRGIARRMQALAVERTRERAKLHQAHITRTTPAVVINDIEVNIRHRERRVDEILRRALQIVRSNTRMKAALDRLTRVRASPTKSAV